MLHLISYLNLYDNEASLEVVFCYEKMLRDYDFIILYMGSDIDFGVYWQFSRFDYSLLLGIKTKRTLIRFGYV